MRHLTALALLVAALAGCTESTTPEGALPNVDAEAFATPAAFNAEGAPIVAFDVPDMMCEHSCAPAVRRALAAQPGVKDVKVELETKLATVAVDQTVFDPQAAIAALVDLQFKNTKLHEDAAAAAN